MKKQQKPKASPNLDLWERKTLLVCVVQFAAPYTPPQILG